MKWFERLLPARPGRRQVSPLHQQRLHRLSEIAPPPIRREHALIRYVAVDVETTGPDLNRDRVISIGAVAIRNRRVELADCFEVVLQQQASSGHDNILVHRIGAQRQLGGVEPAEALVRFLEFARLSPLVAFRAEFDRTMLERELMDVLGLRTHNLWLDLAKLLPSLFQANDCRTMDAWVRHLGVPLTARHDALADALATAQMLQVCLAAADRVDMGCPAELDEMQRAQHWLGKR